MKKLTALILIFALTLILVSCDSDKDVTQAGYDQLKDDLDKLQDDIDKFNNNLDRINSGNHPESSVNVGDVIEFGGYDWQVLDVQDGKALILSVQVLASQPYHADGGDITWENSSIRGYLNGEFLNSLSESDRTRIAETSVINNDNPNYGTSGGNNTTDEIFLLSISEVESFFTDSSSRIALNADGEVVWWWLRSPGNFRHNAVFVFNNGNIDLDGYNVSYDLGVRPALWLKL
ncbi:MAG: DUF6273 domain-containing protein [Oscillospiraceae bacterium]|nr:DUF6273 domain-containing protein [Oscillospiraceae bacterium]